MLNFSENTLLVSPNERQALALWEADARQHQERGDKAWETLQVCSWSEFLKALWEDHWLAARYSEKPPTLLNEWQERFLWIKVLQESAAGGELLNLPAAAQLAADAWKLTQGYQLEDELRAESSYWPEDTQVFLTWVESFQTLCRAKGWLESCRLESRLSEQLLAGALPQQALPKLLRCLGFAEWTPSQTRVLEALKSCGVEVRVEQETRTPNPDAWRKFAAVDKTDEIRTACRWLRYQLERSTKKRLKVGLVIPELAQNREQVSQLLTEVLQPSLCLNQTPLEHTLHDISAGLPLSRWPVVGDALTLLRLDGRAKPLENWKTLLTSPFVGEGESESSSRAFLWNRLCRDGRFQVDWKRVTRLASFAGEEPPPHWSPSLAARLEAVSHFHREPHSEFLPSHWATEFAESLEAFGWPGERALNSSEYQTVTRWKKTLTQFGSLDQLLGSITREAAHQVLRRICDEAVFQPQSKAGQVEVLGTLEAVGLHFDYLWIAGLHDGVWPPAAKPNPYLPFTLQKKHQIAHATPERELDFARRVTDQLLKASRFGVVSYPLHFEEQHCRPSPILRKLKTTTDRSLKLSHNLPLVNLFFESAQLEILKDLGPPPLPPEVDSPGGTSLFKNQAACPFRAFAYHRLQARPADPVREGLNAAQRGTMLHSALEHLWQQVRSQSRWFELTAQGQAEQIAESASFAVMQMRRFRADVLRGLMVRLERQRLESLLTEWMELESQRDDFQVVATEEKVDLSFAGLTVRATVDRLDRLRDGSLAVIDYKTGNARVQDWMGERPREPQLPLYSVAHPRPVDTLCFARLKTGAMGFHGLSRGGEVIPGVEDSESTFGLMPWLERQEEWKQHLENLAREFRSGLVAVDPVEGPRSCQYCGLQSLCRIDERDAL